MKGWQKKGGLVDESEGRDGLAGPEGPDGGQKGQVGQDAEFVSTD